MGNVWTLIKGLGALLEEDERQSVLGDIQERGTSVRSLADVAGLVLLRQMQGWQVWFPWMMAMLFPAFSIVYGTLAVGQVAWNIDMLNTPTAQITACVCIGAPILAWSMGFTLGSIGKRRGAIVLPCMALLFAVLTQAEARKVTRHGIYGVATVGVLIALLAVIPTLFGYLRGLRGAPLPRAVMASLAVLVILCAAVVIPAATGLIPTNLLIVAPLTLWPAVYAFTRPVHAY